MKLQESKLTAHVVNPPISPTATGLTARKQQEKLQKNLWWMRQDGWQFVIAASLANLLFAMELIPEAKSHFLFRFLD